MLFQHLDSPLERLNLVLERGEFFGIAGTLFALAIVLNPSLGDRDIRFKVRASLLDVVVAIGPLFRFSNEALVFRVTVEFSELAFEFDHRPCRHELFGVQLKDIE